MATIIPFPDTRAVTDWDNLCERLNAEGGSGPLLEVARLRARASVTGDDLLSGENLEALRLRFTGFDLCILCLGETDELAVVAGPDFDVETTIDLLDTLPWKTLGGAVLYTTGFLTNDRGYLDGLQLHFGLPEKGVLTRIQLESVASRIRIWTLQKTDDGDIPPDA
jgi:hypothetical protein